MERKFVFLVFLIILVLIASAYVFYFSPKTGEQYERINSRQNIILEELDFGS